MNPCPNWANKFEQKQNQQNALYGSAAFGRLIRCLPRFFYIKRQQKSAIDEASLTSNERSPAVLFKGENATVEVSDGALSSILNFLFELWREALRWSEQNPLLFVAVLILILAMFYIHKKHGLERRSLKDQYNRERDLTRQEIEPPLPLLEGRNESDKQERE